MDMGRTWITGRRTREVTLVVFNDEDTLPLLGALALEACSSALTLSKQRLIPVDGLLMSPIMEN